MGRYLQDNTRWVATAMLLVVLLVLPAAVEFLDQSFYISLVSRIMVMAIAALSLNLLMGYGGLISFGHAVYLGIGGYAVGIMAYYSVYDGPLQWAVGIAGSALFALIFGAICLRTRGVYFIMITLAFAQMVHFLGVSLEEYGADDGLVIFQNSQFPVLDLSDDITLYYVIFAIMVLTVLFLHRLVNSRFGMVVRGAKTNEERMRAIGFPPYRYRLVAFIIAGVICGIAGLLNANLETFVSPADMHWRKSAELIFMVVFGGLGSVFGAVWGAFLFLLLRDEVLDALTLHWAAIFGPLLIIVVLYARRGLDGFFDTVRSELGTASDAGSAGPIGRRIVAFAIDAVVVAAGVAAIVYAAIPVLEWALTGILVEAFGWPDIGGALTEVTVTLLILTAYVVWPVGYHIVMVASSRRGTLGKNLMGLAVVGPGGTRVLPRQAFQRIFMQLGGPTVVLLLAGTAIYHAVNLAAGDDVFPTIEDIAQPWLWGAAALCAIFAFVTAAANGDGRAWYDRMVVSRVIDAREAGDG